MTKYIKTTLMLLLAAGFYLTSFGQTDKKAYGNTEAWRYDIEVVATGVQGTYLVKIWSYSKKPDVPVEQAKRNAVHAIIFQGFAGVRGISGKPPLVSDVNIEQEKHEFFADFFRDGGKYMKFVTLTSGGAVAGEDRIKIGKEYKIGLVVSVNVDLLRSDLEDAGIVKKLGAGF